jgi:two-component system CitB family sensor kinase
LREAIADAGESSTTRDPAAPVAVGERVVFVDTRRVTRAGRDLGVVAVIRDRTDVIGLSARLETVSTMTNALRAQRHEFSNRLHVTAGLIDADRVADARGYLNEALDLPPASAAPILAIGEPFLRSLLEAKAIEAAERGVVLALSDDSLVLGRVAAPEDVATVLGNLVDNAVRAAVEAGPPRRVEVELLDDADTLVIVVSDSGAGVGDPDAVFQRRAEAAPADPDAVHGRGYGLPLVRETARRLGGELWLVDAGGGEAGGAVFTARLPHTMTGRADSGRGQDGERTP